MLSLIIPVRDWAIDRIEASIDSFRAIKSKTLAEIVLVDFGSTERVLIKPSGKIPCKIVHVTAGRWSLAEAINVGVVASKNEVLVKIDADILVSPDSGPGVDEYVEIIAAGEFSLAVSQTLDLPPDLTLREAVKLNSSGAVLPGKLRPKWGQGGLVFFARKAWDAIGGFESRYTGWGNEDNDFFDRIRFSGHRVAWTKRDVIKTYHVWHAPSVENPGVRQQRHSNNELSKSDKSILRSHQFIHSNAEKLFAPAINTSLRPLVTVAIATSERLGRSKMIVEAINSFRGQIRNDFEIVIVDNGSSKASTSKLKRDLEKIVWRPKLVIAHDSVASIPRARNIITDMARGRYICIADDDDIAMPNRLADHLKTFEKDGLVHGSHGGWIDFEESTGVIERNKGRERTFINLIGGASKVSLHPASFFRRDVMAAIRYDESMSLGSDWDLTLRMALNGLEVPHTHSYVTLRRFHAKNVTITGLSEQAHNGTRARSRQILALGWREFEAAKAAAKEAASEVHCTNDVTLDSLLKMLPAYTGEWQLLVPLNLLAWTDASAENASGTPRNNSLRPDPEILKQLMRLTSGDICTRRSGLSQPFFFRSGAVRGAARASALKAKLEAIVHAPIEVSASDQVSRDRQQPFAWKSLSFEPGSRVLRSTKLRSCSETLIAYGTLAIEPALAATTMILADWDEGGENYSLVTSGIKGYDYVQQTKFNLTRLTGLAFESITAGGKTSELTRGERNH